MGDSLGWLTPGDPIDTLLAVGQRSLYIATAKPGELDTAHDMVRTGSDPDRVLPNSRLRIKQEQLRQVRHQRDTEWLKFQYVDDLQKTRTKACTVGDCARAAEVAREIAVAMNLSTVPREEMAGFVDITSGPAIMAGIPLVMLGIMYFAAINMDPKQAQAPRFGRAAALRAITVFLGPQGVLAVMLLIVLAVVGFCSYRFVQRPVVDVYSAGGH